MDSTLVNCSIEMNVEGLEKLESELGRILSDLESKLKDLPVRVAASLEDIFTVSFENAD